MQKDHGFTLIEALLVLVIVGMLGGTGWYVYRAHNNAQNSYANADNANLSTTIKKKKSPPPVQMKEYKDTNYGYSFEYPSSWTLSKNLSDIGRGGLEGDVSVKSPYGTEVHLGPDFGGKGGDCWDDQANARTTRTCSTLNSISVDKLSNGSTQPVYFYKASITPPTDAGGKIFYFVYIGSGPNTITSTGSILLGLTPPYDAINLKQKAYVTPLVEGPDDLKSDSAAFFNSKEIQEATPVLQSFKVL